MRKRERERGTGARQRNRVPSEKRAGQRTRDCRDDVRSLAFAQFTASFLYSVGPAAVVSRGSRVPAGPGTIRAVGCGCK